MKPSLAVIISVDPRYWRGKRFGPQRWFNPALTITFRDGALQVANPLKYCRLPFITRFTCEYLFSDECSYVPEHPDETPLLAVKNPYALDHNPSPPLWLNIGEWPTPTNACILMPPTPY